VARSHRELDPRGRVVLVTGGARGIGRAIAEKFIAAGARAVIGDIDAEVAAATATEIGATSRRLDVTDGPAFAGLVESLEAELGPIDVLVNNAGIMSLGGFLEQAPENDERQVAINVLGVVNGMRAVLPRMIVRKQGRIVNIASVGGKIGLPSAAMYAATKHAIIGLTESIRLEHRGSGVRFSVVLPAPVRTELFAGAKALRFPRLVEPEEVGDAVVDAVRTGRLEVYVPRHLSLLSFLPGLVPLRVRDFVSDLAGVDRVFRDHDPAIRESYVARTTKRR
jgi:hypothetical protein